MVLSSFAFTLIRSRLTYSMNSARLFAPPVISLSSAETYSQRWNARYTWSVLLMTYSRKSSIKSAISSLCSSWRAVMSSNSSIRAESSGMAFIIPYMVVPAPRFVGELGLLGELGWELLSRRSLVARLNRLPSS